LFTCLAPSTLKIEAVLSSEMSVNIHQTSRCQLSDASISLSHFLKNLISTILVTIIVHLRVEFSSPCLLVNSNSA
jgi:hypothetical protein